MHTRPVFDPYLCAARLALHAARPQGTHGSGVTGGTGTARVPYVAHRTTRALCLHRAQKALQTLPLRADRCLLRIDLRFRTYYMDQIYCESHEVSAQKRKRHKISIPQCRFHRPPATRKPQVLPHLPFDRWACGNRTGDSHAPATVPRSARPKSTRGVLPVHGIDCQSASGAARRASPPQGMVPTEPDLGDIFSLIRPESRSSGLRSPRPTPCGFDIEDRRYRGSARA